MFAMTEKSHNHLKLMVGAAAVSLLYTIILFLGKPKPFTNSLHIKYRFFHYAT